MDHGGSSDGDARPRDPPSSILDPRLENTMANPLKMLKLKPSHFQFIQELKIDAPPKRVWAALVDVGSWFRFEAGAMSRSGKLELWPGGRFYAERPDGSSSLHAIVTHIEPEKLLRMSGPMGLSHLPVMNAFIFELQPRAGAKGTLLRLCHRSFGYMDAMVGKRYGEGWRQLLGQLKALAESQNGSRAPSGLRRRKRAAVRG
jgi:uncharacterized protein YndB with AHSA1/START domain